MHLPRMTTASPAATAEAPDANGMVHTGSISSTVDLDFVHGEAHKVYHPSRPVRWLYRLAFQAPFPYVANHAALEAARLRRRIVDLLTRYWFGHHLVARVLDVEDAAGGAHDFVTQLIRGAEPRDKRRAKAFLKALDRRFMAAGIATWQITPFNPHSVTNLIERPDGSYRIIDLESSLVSFLYPISRLVGSIRAGLVPSFDDVDVARLEAYVAEHAGDMREKLGPEYAELAATIERYREAQDAWHACEPRLLNKTLRFLLHLGDVPTWLRGVKGMLARGERAARDQLRAGVDQWVQEGRLSREAAGELLAALNTPEVERAFVHLGAHFAISLPLRFPLGALSRFTYTVLLRLKAEIQGLLRLGRPAEARRLHTISVAMFALLPGFGRLAYLLSPSLSAHPLLGAIPLDHVSRKLPFNVYRRFHLESLFVYWGASGGLGSPRLHSLKGLLPAIVARHFALRPYWGLIAAVIAVNATAFVAGGWLYLGAGRPANYWWFDDFGVTQSMEAVQLTIAGLAGIRAYQLFWRSDDARRTAADAFGIFLWLAGGTGLLVFAVDNFFGLHERAGGLIAGTGAVPSFVNLPDDIFVLAYVMVGIMVLAVFKDELFRARNSTALLIPASLFSLAMAISDIAAEPLALTALEFPAQTLAVACLSLAFVVRYLEVKQGGEEPAGAILTVPVTT